MFLQKLLDPEDERRRRVRRARIVRRNRIKREVGQGLELRRPRVPRPFAFEAVDGDWSEPTELYHPTFGGNSDESKRDPAVDNVNQIRAFSQSSKVKSPFASSPSPALSSSTATTSTQKQEFKSSSPLIRAKWKSIFEQVVFQHHEEVLAKDPNRKWRQERFGLLLFNKHEYTRASEHLAKAITLGATSSICWRRLAESYLHMWEEGRDWEVLWACRAAYEQALSHVEVASSPTVLLTYAKVLELLGNYTGALTICASILQTFPKFEQLREVKLRFVLLQRYQLFSSVATDSVAELDRQNALRKCIEYTQELLLDKAIVEGPRHINVMYLHTRLNELLCESTGAKTPTSQTLMPKGKTQPLTATKPKAPPSSTDVLFQELYKLSTKDPHLAPSSAVKWKAWKSNNETYTIFAEYFQAQGENVLATDALSRSLELLEELPVENDTGKALNPWRGMTEEQRRKRISVYVVLARNYYQCNQMERAIRAMEAVFQLDSLHAEARASLVKWFPAKWQYRLELEDASQVQIARVLRGLWGRNIALSRRRDAQRVAKKKYLKQPYNLGCRRQVVKLLRDKYAPLFVAQDLAARSIQRQARKYLNRARGRWKLADLHHKHLHDLKSKYQTRKYRYNRQVRSKLAKLLPDEYERRFFLEDCSALRIQRYFRGNRVRREFRRLQKARRQQQQHLQDAAHTIQRFFRRYCRAQCNPALTADELLFRAQNQLVRAKERLALKLQRLCRRWKSARPRKQSAIAAMFGTGINEQRRLLLEHASVLKIQRVWRRYTAGEALGGRVSSQGQIFIVEHFHAAQKQQSILVFNLDHAARKIQALYRGKHMRKLLSLLRGRLLAPPSASPIATLIGRYEKQHKEGIETLATLHSVDSLSEKRALFDHSVLVLDGAAKNTSFPLQHIVSAIQYSTMLKCLAIAGGDFIGDRILTLVQAIQTRRTLRVLAIGKISDDFTKKISNQEPDIPAVESHPQPGETTAREVFSSMTLSQRSVLLPSPPSSPQPHQKRQLSAMQIVAKALCTSNFLLEELYLEQNSLLSWPHDGAIVANFLSDYFFARYGRLHTLVIAHMRFSDENGASLGAALAINTVLKTLDLHGNLLCDGAAIAIANDGLVHNKSLGYLNLAENTIASTGGKALFQCLATSNRTLHTLILRNNHLMSDVMPSLVKTWQSNGVIENVDLAGNLIDPWHLEQIHVATAERREVTPSKDNLELRLLLARKRFECHEARSLIGRKGIGIVSATPTSPSTSKHNKNQKKNGPLSPKKWLSANAPTTISPLHYPVIAHEMFPVPKLSPESVYAPNQPRKGGIKGKLNSHSKLPALPGKKRITW